MAAAVVVELPELPSRAGLARVALAGARRRARPAELDGKTLVVRGVRVDAEHLSAYDRACGFRLADVLPPTYPHVLAFPLAMRLMTEPTFPLAPVGLVHVANAITKTRPITLDEEIDLSVRASDLRPHRRGTQFDMVVAAAVGGVEVWRDVSTYLRRSKTPSAATPAGEAAPSPSGGTPSGEPIVTWRPTREVGIAYARASGDRNPIHTSRLGAKAFGFPAPIAHGMWTLARCLSTLDNQLPEAYRIEVAFKRPILLPSTVALWARPAEGGWDLDVAGVADGAPHLTGAIRPLA